MPRSRARSIAGSAALAVLACTAPPPAAERTPPPPAPAVDTPPPHAVDTPPPPAVDTPPPPAAPEPGERPPATAPATATPPADVPDPSAPAGVSYTVGPLAATPVDAGALVVWSRHDAAANKSELLALLLDAEGAPQGAPRLVRRTTGQILDVDVHRRDGDAWVAWVAKVGEDPNPRALVAALLLAADLSSVHPPITLHQFVDPNLEAWPERSMVRVLDLASGLAAVGAASNPAECTDTVDGRTVKCPGFDLFWARPDGTHTLALHTGPDGGDPGVGDLIDVGTGVLLDLWAWHGGATFANIYAPYDQPAAAPPFTLVDCHPPFTRAWTGAELVTLCPGDYAGEGERCPLNGGDELMCDRVHVLRADGTPVTPRRDAAAPQTAYTEKCADGHPVVDVAWSGGKQRLDPLRPGASFDLDLGVWTGRTALRFADGGDVERWKCGPKGAFVQREAPGDPLTLDPAEPPRPVPASKPAPAG